MADLIALVVALLFLGAFIYYLPVIVMFCYGLFTVGGIPFVLMIWIFGGGEPPPGMANMYYLHMANYSLIVLAMIGIWLFRPDPAGLPKALRFLAEILPTPTGPREAGGSINLTKLANELRERAPGAILAKQRARFDAFRYRKAADSLKAETEHAQAKAEVARAARALNEAQQKLKAAKKDLKS